MPTESKSETPRMQAVQFTCHCLLEDKAVPFKDAEQLEKELNEANQKLQRYHDLVRYQRAELHQSDLITDQEYASLLSDSKSVARLEGYDAIKQERNDLAKELADAKEIINIERQHREVNNEVQLAKEKKVMREALENFMRHFHTINDDTAWTQIEPIPSIELEFAERAMSKEPSDLIVLTRNELIAEIEKMVCRCSCPSDKTNWVWPRIKVCDRCQWLTRVKGEV